MTRLTSSSPLYAVGVERRHTWDDFVRWLDSTRGQRVVWVLLGLWILNGLDLAVSLLAQEQGVLNAASECNPIAARVLSLGPLGLVSYKLLLVAGGTVPLLLQRKRLLAEIASTAALLVYAFVVVQWTVCFQSSEVQELLAAINSLSELSATPS
jgi:hypothetical protein